MKRPLRTLLAAAGLIVLSVGVTACGPPPWEVEASTRPTSTATRTAPPTITPVQNDLATGSTKRTMQAGAVVVEAIYDLPSLPMDKWTPGANKPIRLNVTSTVANDEGQAVYLSRLVVTTGVNGPDGPLPAPAPSVDQATVSPGYAMKAPYSYSQTYIIGAVDPAATSITLNFSYELLLQTTPTSNEYAKATASDILTIALVPEPVVQDDE